jgi:hypothetical protein
MLLLTFAFYFFAVGEKISREILSLAKCAKSESSSVRSKLFSGREIWMRHQLYNNDYLR